MRSIGIDATPEPVVEQNLEQVMVGSQPGVRVVVSSGIADLTQASQVSVHHCVERIVAFGAKSELAVDGGQDVEVV